jgi:hypothetical protein
MDNVREMQAVDKPEFDEWVRRHNAVPDGFKLAGSYTQTRYYSHDTTGEVARFSRDSFGDVYEINPNRPPKD